MTDRTRRRTRPFLIGFFVLALVLFAGTLIAGIASWTGAFATGALAAAALLVASHPGLKSFAFTIWVFAFVAASMFYPSLFGRWFGADLSVLIVPLIQVIMFGMGTTLSVKDFGRVLTMPWPILVGVVLQFTVMPLVGFSIAKTFGFSPEVAAGIILIGSVSSGVASNVMSYLAGGNVPLSVTITSCTTLISPFVTPLWMKALAGRLVPVNVVEMMLSILNMVIVPVLAGLVAHRILYGGKEPARAGGVLDKLAAGLRAALPAVSMFGICLIIGIITARSRDQLLTVGLALFAASILHNGLGYLLGYWGARAARLDESSCRTVAFEVGMQNGGMASGIAMQVLKSANAALAPAIFGPWMNISGSILANWWRRHPPKK